MSRITHCLTGALVLAVCFWAPTWAQMEDRSLLKGSESPIRISADRNTTQITPDGVRSLFEGHVRARQGDLQVHADRMVLVTEKEESDSRPQAQGPGAMSKKGSLKLSDIKSITASGNVKVVYRDFIATAGKGLYDYPGRTITLTGGPPRFWHGPNMGVAHTIIYYIDKNKFVFKNASGRDAGSPDAQPPEIVINPRG